MNALINLFIQTQTEPKLFYAFIFKEDLYKDELVFDSLIDPDRKYDFEKKVNDITDDPAVEFLTDNELRQRLDAFDFNLENDEGYSNESGLTMLATMNDEMNQHECMDSFTRIIVHLSNQRDQSEQDVELPNWLKSIHKRLTCNKTKKNVRLFLLKLILNCGNVLKKYSSHFLPQILNDFADGRYENVSFDWLITDLMTVMTVSWTSKVEKNVLQKFLTFLIPLIYSNNREIVRSNLYTFSEFLRSSEVNGCIAPEIVLNLMEPIEDHARWVQFKLDLFILLLTYGAAIDLSNEDEIIRSLLQITQSYAKLKSKVIESLALMLKNGSSVKKYMSIIVAELPTDRPFVILRKIGTYCPIVVKHFLRELKTQLCSNPIVAECLSIDGVINDSDEASDLLSLIGDQQTFSLGELQLIKTIIVNDLCNPKSIMGLVNNLFGRTSQNNCKGDKLKLELLIDICLLMYEMVGTKNNSMDDFLVQMLHTAVKLPKDEFYSNYFSKILQVLLEANRSLNLATLIEKLFLEHDQSHFLRLCCKVILMGCEKTSQYRKVMFENALHVEGSMYALCNWNPHSATETFESIAGVIDFSASLSSNQYETLSLLRKRKVIDSEHKTLIRAGKRRRFKADFADAQEATRFFGGHAIRKWQNVSNEMQDHNSQLLRTSKPSRQYEKLAQIPDVQITFSEIIEPLVKVCSLDCDSASELFSQLVVGSLDDACLLMSEEEHQNFVKAIWNQLKIVLEKSIDHLLTKTMLSNMRILVAKYGVRYDFGVEKNDQILSNIILTNNCDSGIHFLEDCCIQSPDNANIRLLLANLYQHTNDLSSVFAALNSAKDDMDHESVSDYERALTIYADKLKKSSSSSSSSSTTHEFIYFQICISSCRNMGKWQKMNDFYAAPHTKIDCALNRLGNRELWPTYVQLRLRQNPREVSDFLLSDDGTSKIARKLCPIETALCYFGIQDFDAANSYLKLAKDTFFESWRCLLKQTSKNTDSTQKLFANVNLIDEISNAVQIAAQSRPIDRELPFNLDFDDHCVHVWENVLLVRTLTHKVLQKMGLLNHAFEANNDKMLEHAQCSLSQNNFCLALEKLKCSGKVVSRVEEAGQIAATLCYLNVHLKRAMISDSHANFQKLTDAQCFILLKDIKNFIDNENVLDDSLIFDFVTTLHILLKISLPHFREDILVTQKISDILEPKADYELMNSCALALQSYAERVSPRKLAESRMSVCEFTDECMCRSLDNKHKISQSEAGVLDNARKTSQSGNENAALNNTQLESESAEAELAAIFVENLMRALELGSARSAFLKVPRLVQIIGMYDFCAEILNKHKIECWWFLGSLDLLCSVVKEKRNGVIMKLLNIISQQYPEHLYFPYRLSKLQDLGGVFANIHHYLIGSTSLKNLENALGTLQNPDHAFKDWKNEMLMKLNVSECDHSSIITRYFRYLYGEILNEEFAGSFRRHFILTFRPKLKAIFGEAEIKEMNVKTLENTLNNIQTEMSQYCNQMPLQLDAYSLWFNEIHLLKHKRLRLPGRYDTSCGHPPEKSETQLSIIGFSATLVVLPSLRRPKKIEIKLDDGSKRAYMIKSGEDLRQDERILGMMNTFDCLLQDDYRCRKRELSCSTFQVTPINERLGMIEWIRNTDTLKSFIEHGMSDDERNKFMLNRPIDKYVDYVRLNSSVDKGTADQYIGLFEQSTKSLENQFKLIQKMIPSLLLRRSYVQISANCMEFIYKRNNYVRSLAVLSVLTYVLGLGDRHQSNFLIEISTGSLFAIDFGCAFGNATIMLPIPELMPFRLTQQMIAPMLPNQPSNLFKTLMVNVITSIRQNMFRLISQLNVFACDLSIDWEANSAKLTKIHPKYGPEFGIVYAYERIRSVRRRLIGICPAIVFIEDLESGMHGWAGNPNLNNFKSVLLESLPENLIDTIKTKGAASIRSSLDFMETHGIDEKKLITMYSNKPLTVGLLVDCLINQATHCGILCRTWGGWEPFV